MSDSRAAIIASSSSICAWSGVVSLLGLPGQTLGAACGMLPCACCCACCASAAACWLPDVKG